MRLVGSSNTVVSGASEILNYSTNEWCLKKNENLKARIGYMLVICEFTYTSLFLENLKFLLKSTKTSFLAVWAHFLTFWKNNKNHPWFFDETSKTGLGFEIKQIQRKCQRRSHSATHGQSCCSSEFWEHISCRGPAFWTSLIEKKDFQSLVLKHPTSPSIITTASKWLLFHY